MNKIAALMAVGVGGTFFVHYNPVVYGMNTSLGSFLTSNQSKARDAVSKLLHNPGSANFDALRTVEITKAKYVCGNVNGKDRTGSYAGSRPFVYDVLNDFARINDDWRIAKIHAAFKPCPVTEEEKSSTQALEMAKKILKAAPKIDPAELTKSELLDAQNIQSRTFPSAGSQSGQQAEPQAATKMLPQATSAFNASLETESEWRSNRPPLAWPRFPLGDPLTEPVRKRTNGETLTLASNVDERWVSYKTGKATSRPSASEIKEALRALLAIDPKSPEFPRAWDLFIRLRQADRDTRAADTRR